LILSAGRPNAKAGDRSPPAIDEPLHTAQGVAPADSR
jgi:hypothetical protein